MNRALAVAHTEILEHWRQKWMLLVMAASYGIWVAGFAVIFGVLDAAQSDPGMQRELLAAGLGDIHQLVPVMVGIFNGSTSMTLPLLVAILSGYSVLHERISGTLPFLLSTKLSGLELVMGKLMGLMAIPLILHFIFLGGSTLIFKNISVLEASSAQLGGSVVWWVVYLFATPACAVMVGGLGILVSLMARDVRTSWQTISFGFWSLSLGLGFVLGDTVTYGAGVQAGLGVVCLVLAGVGVAVAARLLQSRAL